MIATDTGRAAFENLKRLARSRRAKAEQCELCSAALGSAHPHLLNAGTRNILCSCDACAILFPGRADQSFRRIPRNLRFLGDFKMGDAQWDALRIPIEMAFFCRTGTPSRPVAFYPSPAGAIESLLSLDAWEEIVRENPAIAKMEDEVETLLVNRTMNPHEYYLAPIDECYGLVGLIRSQWRGLSGGKEVWQAIGGFFVSLKSRAIHTGGDSHA